MNSRLDKNVEQIEAKNKKYLKLIDSQDNIKIIENERQNEELKLIDVKDLVFEDNGKLVLTVEFDELSRNLSLVQIFELKQLLQVSKIVGLKLVNIENGIGVDNKNRVISSTYNVSKGVCDIDLANVLENDIKEEFIEKVETPTNTTIEISNKNIAKEKPKKNNKKRALENVLLGISIIAFISGALIIMII